MGGVQWQVLVSRYEERYSTRLDLAVLGHSSPLGAAATLLWEVLRVVDKEDSDNPVVGIEDRVALTPRPGFLGCWPSLYGVLCTIVRDHGTREQAGSTSHSLLMSQLRPLLETHWHTSSDDALGFRSEDGTFRRFKKMKHLLHALLRWREQRQAWQHACGSKPTAVDEVLSPPLELLPSQKHSDLLLRCVLNQCPPTPPIFSMEKCLSPGEASLNATTMASSAVDGIVQSEIEQLRAENAELRAVNLRLQIGKNDVPDTSVSEGGLELTSPPRLPADLFDDPFEPPPQFTALSMPTSPTLSCKSCSVETDTDMWGTASCSSGWMSGRTSVCTSGAVTPVHQATVPQASRTMISAWFPFMPSMSNGVVDISVIPRGIVQSAREQFERIVGQ